MYWSSSVRTHSIKNKTQTIHHTLGFTQFFTQNAKFSVTKLEAFKNCIEQCISANVVFCDWRIDRLTDKRRRFKLYYKIIIFLLCVACIAPKIFLDQILYKYLCILLWLQKKNDFGASIFNIYKCKFIVAYSLSLSVEIKIGAINFIIQQTTLLRFC